MVPAFPSEQQQVEVSGRGVEARMNELRIGDEEESTAPWRTTLPEDDQGDEIGDDYSQDRMYEDADIEGPGFCSDDDIPVADFELNNDKFEDDDFWD